MKKIEAIVRHFKLEDVKEALDPGGRAGDDRHGGPRIRTPTRTQRRCTAVPNTRSTFLPKVKLEVVVADSARRKAAVNAIVEAARTGNVGDGKIFISELASVVRIRTGETGEPAV